MLKHRNIVILFLLLFAGLLIANRFYTIHWLLYVLAALMFLGIEFYGAYFIHSGFHLKASCKANTHNKILALTFDDGPAGQTEKVLEVLDEFKVKATFFCIGKQVQGREALLKHIADRGHLLGNHSDSHAYLYDLKTTGALVEDISRCNEKIHAVTGKTPLFFRPPYGVTTPGLSRAVKKLKLEVIGWNIRSLDTSIKDPQRVLSRIRERLEPGSIVLMHDTVHGIEIVLKELLVYLKEQNYTVVPLDQLLQKKAYA